MNTVTLCKNVRLFTRVKGIQLASSGESALAGTEFEIINDQVMVYDHRHQRAIEVETNDGRRWILAEEAGLKRAA